MRGRRLGALVGCVVLTITGTTLAGPLDRYVDKVAKGGSIKNVCFGWSAKTKQVACFSYSFSSEGAANAGPQFWSIVLVQTTRGKKDRTFLVGSAQRGASAPHKVHKRAVAKAKAALVRGGFVGWRSRSYSLASSSRGRRLAGMWIRRQQTKVSSESPKLFDDLQVRCGGRWIKARNFGGEYLDMGNGNWCCDVSGTSGPRNGGAELTSVCFRKSVGGALHYDKIHFGPGR